MIFCIGIYEVEFENNVIQIPRAWRKRISKADSLYCKLDEYVSKDDEKLIKMTCSFDRDYFDDTDDDDGEVFTIAIDRKHRMHLPKKYMDKCGFEANDSVLLMGWGEIITIQAKRDKLKLENIDEVERLIHQTDNPEVQ